MPRSQLLALEQRMMFDGAAAGTLVDLHAGLPFDHSLAARDSSQVVTKPAPPARSLDATTGNTSTVKTPDAAQAALIYLDTA